MSDKKQIKYNSSVTSIHEKLAIGCKRYAHNEDDSIWMFMIFGCMGGKEIFKENLKVSELRKLNSEIEKIISLIESDGNRKNA